MTSGGHEDLTAEDLVVVDFRTSRGGYDQDDVDNFIDRQVQRLRRGLPLSAPEIRSVEFGRSRAFRSGYHEPDVDDFLERLHRQALRGSAPGRPHPATSVPTDVPTGPSTDGDARLTPDSITQVAFGMRRGGYDCGQVDDFLDLQVQRLRDGRLSAEEITSARFSPVSPFREGYVEADVDDLLERLRVQAGRPAAPQTVSDDRVTICPESLHRRDVWHVVEGGLPRDGLLNAVAASAGRDVLVIGCPDDGMAPDIADRLPEAALTVHDPWTEDRLTVLPHADASFDLVCAPWSLHRADSIDQTVREIARVLRPDGVLLAMADSDQHLADLWAEVGGGPAQLRFSRELGSGWLRRHFAEVEQVDFETRAVLGSRQEAYDHLAWHDADAADRLPQIASPREYAGHSTMLIATP